MSSRRKSALARTVLFLALVAAPLALITDHASAAGTTYYVDAVNGSDTANGTSAATAWKSLAKINATTFQPGDSILLHSGDTWSGQLHPLGSGSATGGSITISSYGGTARPKIDAGGRVAGGGCTEGSAVFFSNQHHWAVNGLEIVNNSGVSNLADGTHRHGICFINGSGGILSGVSITNNYIHNVNGCFTCTGYDGHTNGAIIVVVQEVTGNSSWDDVYISGNTIADVGRVGIAFGDWSTGGVGGTPYMVNQSSLSTRVTVRNNTINNVDGDGIIIKGAVGSLIEGNVVGNSGLQTVEGAGNPESAGIWWSHTFDTTVQYNEVYGTRTHGFGGQGYDIDAAASNSKIQYNFSHDNEGGFLLLMGLGVGSDPSPSKNGLVRYNLSVNDAFPGTVGEAVITMSYGVTDKLEIQNNTIYVPPGSPAWIINCSQGAQTDGCSDTAGGDWRFRNNIVVNHGTGGYDYLNLAGAVFEKNLYYGNHPASEPPEPGKLTSDPQLVSPGSASPSGYQVASTSPAIGAGALQAQNGGRDYFGRVLSLTAPPTIGFHEGATFAGPAKLVDKAGDMLAIQRHATNVVLGTANPANFSGDASRFTRSTNAVGTVTWLFDGMASFNATVYFNIANLAGLTWWTSPDGRVFTQRAATNTTPVATAGGYKVATVSPAAALPAGTRFVMAQIDYTGGTLGGATGANNAIQIGEITITK